MLERFSFPSVHNLEVKSPFRMLLSEWVRSSGIPAILLTSPHIRRDGSSQPFPKLDSQLQKLLNTRSGEIWLELVLPLLLLLLLFYFPSSFSALSSFLFPFPLFCSQPAIFTSSSSFSLQDCLPHSYISMCFASPGSLGSWNVSCHEWRYGWERKAHSALNKGKKTSKRP